MRNRTKSNENAPREPQRRRAPAQRPVLFLEERRSRINELIETRERATVRELAARFGVSPVTIRGDLDALAKAGGVIRSHGGALRCEEDEATPIDLKQTLRRAEKMRIAAEAARHIREGETIILDSGTT